MIQPFELFASVTDDEPANADGSIPSLLKWTGSKRYLAAKIWRHIPSHRHYFEPFVGGGAMLYNTFGSAAFASDVYRPLIALWQLLKDDPEKVVADYREKWKTLNAELDSIGYSGQAVEKGAPKVYYEIRSRFNREEDPLDLNFLLRTCVNGIVRFNDRGEFNNSFHLSRRGMEPSRFEKIVAAWLPALRRTTFSCLDYAEALVSCESGDFVYLDPPYAGNKQRYTNDLDLGRFFDNLRLLNSRGVRWALSFDGHRGEKNLVHGVPDDLFKRHMLLSGGSSAVHRVLNGPIELVRESLYLNF